MRLLAPSNSQARDLLADVVDHNLLNVLDKIAVDKFKPTFSSSDSQSFLTRDDTTILRLHSSQKIAVSSNAISKIGRNTNLRHPKQSSLISERFGVTCGSLEIGTGDSTTWFSCPISYSNELGKIIYSDYGPSNVSVRIWPFSGVLRSK